jgi:hypothetical protein
MRHNPGHRGVIPSSNQNSPEALEHKNGVDGAPLMNEKVSSSLLTAMETGNPKSQHQPYRVHWASARVEDDAHESDLDAISRPPSQLMGDAAATRAHGHLAGGTRVHAALRSAQENHLPDDAVNRRIVGIRE